MALTILLISLAYLAILLVFGLYSTTIFYHINRYSYIGDASKRVFLLYIIVTTNILIIGLFLIISNHLF